MTREEAKMELIRIKRVICMYDLPSEAFEALDTAIEALQQITCKDCRHKYEEGDCTHYYWCRLHDRPVDDNNYCCWAERRK